MDTNRSNGNDDYDDDGDGGDNVEYDDGDNVEYDDGDNVEYDGRDNAEYDGGDDNFNVEDDVEADAQDDQIPENHYKMVAFQTAIQAVLERQIEKLQLEVNENARLVTIGTKESQEAAKHLHDEQKCLVLEEDNVRSAAERLDRTQSRRERREKENRDYRAEVERSEADLEQRIVHNEQLRAEVNDLTGQSLRYQLRRLEVEGEVGVDQACSDKGEQDFKVAQEAKQFQDKYIGKRVGDRRCGDRAPPTGQLAEEVEQLEGVAGQYEVQAAAMDRGTLDTRDTVRRAEAELASVRGEVARVVTNWTNTVININKVDN